MTITRTGLLFCIIGPAGSGKTTLAKKLLEDFPADLSRSISVTSRAPRPGETDGVNYHFVTREEFNTRVATGDFFEWEETHGNLYGTLKNSLEDSIRSSKDLILDIDIRGALNFKKAYPDNTVIVFLMPPSADELMRRMKGRSEVGAEELAARLSTAKTEYSLFMADRAGANAVDYAVVNDTLEVTHASLRGILTAERVRCRRLSFDDLKSLLAL